MVGGTCYSYDKESRAGVSQANENPVVVAAMGRMLATFNNCSLQSSEEFAAELGEVSLRVVANETYEMLDGHPTKACWKTHAIAGILTKTVWSNDSNRNAKNKKNVEHAFKDVEFLGPYRLANETERDDRNLVKEIWKTLDMGQTWEAQFKDTFLCFRLGDQLPDAPDGTKRVSARFCQLMNADEVYQIFKYGENKLLDSTEDEDEDEDQDKNQVEDKDEDDPLEREGSAMTHRKRHKTKTE